MSKSRSIRIFRINPARKWLNLKHLVVTQPGATASRIWDDVMIRAKILDRCRNFDVLVGMDNQSLS